MFSLFSEAAEGTICAQIDADMVLGDKWLLRDVGEYFGEHRDLDYLQVACRDGFSGSPMIGVKFFRAGVDIDFSRINKLRPDRVAVDPSRRRVVLEWVDRIAHCLDPHDEQAVHFGAHRMMKVLKKKEPDLWNAFYLRRTALLAESGHRPSRLAVLGASAVIDRHRDFLPTDLDYTSLDWRNLFLGIQQRELEDDGFFEDAVNAVGSVVGELERSSEATRGVRWVLILPNLQLYGGVYRLLYLARELTRQGDEATIAVVDLQSQDPTLLDAIRAWDLTVASLESVRDDRWDVLVVGDVNGDGYSDLAYLIYQQGSLQGACSLATGIQSPKSLK
jgi:hypothetical protein